MLKLGIFDSTGSKEGVNVSENSLLVSNLPYPPFLKQKVKPFRQYLTSNGTATGSSDMRVVGTLAAPQKFYIPATGESDRYISAISFLIADAGALVNQFGALVALTNGCQLYYETTGESVILHDSLKSNFDLLRLCLFNPPFGSGADTFRSQNVVGASEAFVPVLDLSKLLPPFGVKLDAGTTQKLVISIRDTTTGIDAFNAIAYGFDRFL